MESLMCPMGIMSLRCSFRETQKALLLFLVISTGPGNHHPMVDRSPQSPLHASRAGS